MNKIANREIGYPTFAFQPIYLYLIISDFCKPTYLSNNWLSYVDGPKGLFIISFFIALNIIERIVDNDHKTIGQLSCLVFKTQTIFYQLI